MITVATLSLAGCFGCHMSLLDMDEDFIELSRHLIFDRSPLTDIKTLGHCNIGLIEGGVGNTENLHLLREFRKKCDILVAVGACATTGGIPALRNNLPLQDSLEQAYVKGPGLHQPQIPQDPELPPLFDQLRPLQEWVAIDYFLPGCPPPADMFRRFFEQLMNRQSIDFDQDSLHYD